MRYRVDDLSGALLDLAVEMFAKPKKFSGQKTA